MAITSKNRASPPNEESPLLNRNGDEQEGRHSVNAPDLFIIYTAFFGVLIAGADESLVLSTYSTIASQFERLSQGSWLLVAYNFGYCVALPVYGGLSDSYGRKPVLIVAYILFTAGCVACGASTSLAQLVLARVLAGLSGAGMVSLVSIIIVDLVPPNDVALYRGYENLVNVIGRSLGAPIGGLLSDTIGWRWSFFGQVPLILFCTIVGIYGLPNPSESRIADDQSNDPSETTSPQPWFRRIDFAGIFTFATSILLLLVLLQISTSQVNHQMSWILGLSGGLICASIIFILVELFYARLPLIPVRLLVKDLGIYCLIQVFLYSGRTAFVSNVVPYFARVENKSDFFGSLMYIQVAAGVSAGGMVAGFVIKQTGRYKTMTTMSLLLTIIVFVMITVLWRDGCTIPESLLLFPIGVAPGILFSTLFIGMSSSSPKESRSVCIGTFLLSQQIGTIIGPACGAAIVQGLFQSNLADRLPQLPRRKEVIHQILNDVNFSRSLSPSIQEIVTRCYLSGFQYLPVFATVMTAVTLPIFLMLKERRQE